MEATQMKIGGSIAALRKARGLTQEQLAQQLGVSAPAVSKWETDSSYPDITLLCPLARALGTDVDTLLQFRPDLSNKEAAEQLNRVMDLAMQQDLPGAEARLAELVHQYPGCAALQYMAVSVYDALQMFFPDVEDTVRRRWRTAKRTLLEQLHTSGNPAYWQSATLQLAGLDIAEGELEAGAALLEELPEQTADPTGIRALYYLKKEQPEEALKLTQKQLYKLVSQVLTCLSAMMNPHLLTDPERMLPLCRAYKATALAFGFADMSDGFMAEAYLLLGQPKEAAQCFARYVDILLGPLPLPDKALFTPGMHWDEKQKPQATNAATRRLLLKSLLEEERYRPLFDVPDFRTALEKLKDAV